MTMGTTGQWGKYAILLFPLLALNTLSPFVSGHTVEASSKKQPGDIPRQRTLSLWYSTSSDAVDSVHKYGVARLRSHNRQLTHVSFSKSVYSFEVKEDTVPGTVVGKVEAMQGEKLPPITYSVLEDDGENLFLLSPHSGEFLLSRSLDFETQRFYILTVGMQQGDSQVSSVRVCVNVLDVNDNPPVFRQNTYSASLLEDTPTGTCFLSIDVSDEDDGVNGDLDLRVIAEDEENVFFVNLSGTLCLNAELDRERRPSYNLTVAANDCAQPPSGQFTSTARVIISVEDVNDNAPSFVSAQSVSIPEDTSLHSVVMIIHAEDADVGSNGEVLYYLDDTSGGGFSINTTSGSLYLQEPLDRERVDQLTITLTAIDKGSPRMATSMNLTVNVEDANDHDPEFLQSVYSLSVTEDIPRGTSLFQAQARDLDIGSNGQVRYELSQRSPFVVDTIRGVVSVMDGLDRERNLEYTLIITAVDRGNVPRSATAVVHVAVLDVNDVTPLFSPTTFILHILENGGNLSQLTHQVSALDEDLGVNSQLTYFMQKGNEDFFSLSPNGTFQTLHNLDREKESLYIVNIIAVDSGVPPLTGTATIHVIVDDMNDNRPEFTEDVYNTIVSEDCTIGTVFAMITASDIDDGVSGEIRYSMGNADVPFSIDEASGELVTTDTLDRETVAIYRLTVFGSDKHPTHPLSSSVLVTVLVGDVNDHWPQFLHSPYVANVPAEVAPGSVICAVRATDGDTEMNAELHFSLYGQSADLFSIDPHSGTIFTSSPLRRTEDITVNVHVEDGGENPKFDVTTVSVRFQNASDFPVIHLDVHRYLVSEDEPVGTLVAVVSATSTRGDPVSFYLASGDFEEMFQIHQSHGELRVKNPLDYENKKDFTLLIEARDSGSPPYSSFAEIHINISDVNDNFPQFIQKEYRCEVYENSPPMSVCDVLAIDVDSGNYDTVEYSIIEGNIKSVFTIDSESGVLSTNWSLDREDISEYNLTIEATDQDKMHHKDQATIIVVVLDRNDHAPRFSQIFLSEIPEDTPIGYTVIQITSTDDDAGANAVIIYSIRDQSDDIPFSINITNGCITVVRLLDRETQDHYVVKVNANDSAWSISTDVTIVITDVNDNRPEFSHQFYTTVLPETKALEVFVMQVLATDADDTGQNSQIVYVIEPPNEEFWVNASSGDIYTKQPLTLHNYVSETFSFTVNAFDCGSDPLYSNTTVAVRLVPYNHYPPAFLPFQPAMTIPYDMAVGTEVFQFSAVDQDFNHGSTDVEYVLNEGNASDFFLVQADSGKVMLNGNLSQSLNAFFTLNITARDQGFPPLSSHTEITFEMTEINRFSPRFLELDVTFSVPEDLPVGSVIGKIQAEDGDYGANGVVIYGMTLGNEDLPFSIGESAGLLTLVRGLDFEKEALYHLQIKAMDGGWLSKTGMLNITVNVMDVNDNPPVFSASEYITSVPENSVIGTVVFNVRATDADSGTNAHITYSLVAGYTEKFAIDSRNGTITTMDVFDYEQEQVFDLMIKASNMGIHPLFSVAHVIIQVSDVNEFIPTFKTNKFNISVPTNVPVGTRIGKVMATDFDQGYEGQVFYLMFGQNKNIGFDIDSHSGEIYTTGNLRKQGYNHVVLKILAKNWGVITGMDIDEAVVHISIIETNDPPEFTLTLYSTNTSEDSTVGTSVIRVSALDQDSILEWNRFYFSIERGNKNSSFDIDPFSGIISVNSTLDREQWPLYNLTITATDNGSPPATGTTNVVVTIGDINDNAPRLTMTEAQLRENQPQGTIVATLNASDSDVPPNQGPFTYWFVNPTLGNSFSLTPDGVLSTTRPVDREQNPAFHFLVAVRDAGIPPLSSTTTFHISVLDENDNPSLQRNVYIEVKYYGSTFQGGMIGNVHPEDQDESDQFNCSIKSGSLTMFSIPYGTCELWSSSFQGEATYNITIEATDQLHFPVNNSVNVNYKGFTNATMDSCILFYVSSSSIEEFLSLRYLRFVKALDSLFNLLASKAYVFGIKAIGDEILLLAAVKNYNGQYLSREVASGISAAHKKHLEAQSNVTILRITSDPCLVNLCQNGATCHKNIHISQDVAVLESLAVIFVSPQKEIFNCTCSTGFTGTLCETDIDECEGSPCENDGICVNNPGGFYCHCQTGFSGPFCSVDGDECLMVTCQNGGTCVNKQDGFHCHCRPGYEGEMCQQSVDHCAPSPCVQGNCINSMTGFYCHCPFGVSGVHCEEHSYGFEELSFMEFPPLDPRSNLISLELATVQRNSLLLYNPGGASSQEFLALEILDGKVQFSYDLGSGPVRLETEKQVADGLFHSVTAQRIGNIGSLQVDNCTDVDKVGFCFTQSDGISSKRTLDVGSSNMTFGGLRSIESILLHPTQIKTHDFVGCVRNINVNGMLLRPSRSLATYNILARCPRAAAPPCHSSPCKNDGVCHDLWSHYLCRCRSLYTGTNCATEIPEEYVLRLNGNDYIEYVIKERYKRDHQLRELLDDGIRKEVSANDLTEMEVKFKTQDNGVLVSVLRRKGYTVLRIKDGKLMYVSKNAISGNLSEFTVDVPVADGLWHDLFLLSNGKNTLLRLDGKLVMNTTSGTLDLTPANVDKVVLGAAPIGHSRLQLSGLSGCVEYFKVTGYPLPVSGPNEMVEVWPSSTLIQSSCGSSGFCIPSPCSEEDTTIMTCLSAHCQNGWGCGPARDSGSCICLHNATDQACDVCTTVTENHSGCSDPRQGNIPLWIIAVILPVSFILIFIGLLIALRRQSVKGHGKKDTRNSSPQQKKQGADNIVFCFDDGSALSETESAVGGKPPDIICADKRRSSVELYCDAGPSSVQIVDSTSELEYYERGSIHSASPSDMASLKFSWHKNLYSTNCDRANPKGCGDCQVLLTDLKKDSLSQDGRNGSLLNPNTFASPKRQLLTQFDPGLTQNTQSQNMQPSCVRGFSKPGLLEEPAQCLSVEEVRRLNSTLEKIEPCKYQSCQAGNRPGPVKLTTVIDSSSDSETYSTFTCSEFEYGGQSPLIGAKEYCPHDQGLISAHSFREQDIFHVPCAFKDNSHLSEAKCKTESTPSDAIEQWENILNMHLHFHTYAEVFEDIACLPIELKHDCDMQSDSEEII